MVGAITFTISLALSENAPQSYFFWGSGGVFFILMLIALAAPKSVVCYDKDRQMLIIYGGNNGLMHKAKEVAISTITDVKGIPLNYKMTGCFIFFSVFSFNSNSGLYLMADGKLIKIKSIRKPEIVAEKITEIINLFNTQTMDNL